MKNNKKISFPIDFVVTWVDGNDAQWQGEKSKYKKQEIDDKEKTHFRDPGLFKYWFRGVEKFAPWVNHIYLVTNGQYPEFLDTNIKNLTWVRHEEIMPQDSLPTFNSNAIELSIDKIKGLSEHFVVFNDDMFLIKPVKPTDFFDVDGKPKDTAGLNQIMPVEDFDHSIANNITIINKKFDKKKVLSEQWHLFLNIKNGPLNIYTLLLWFFPRFSRLYDLHIPYSLTKENFKAFFDLAPLWKEKTIRTRFRSKNDLTIWGVRYFQIVSGKISPRVYNFGKFYTYKQKDAIIKELCKAKHSVIDINDVEIENYDRIVFEIVNAFEKKFPEKSTFEK